MGDNHSPFLYPKRPRQRILEDAYLGSQKSENYKEKRYCEKRDNCPLLRFAACFVFVKELCFVDI